MSVSLVFTVAMVVARVSGHGYLLVPPARNSAWRSDPENWEPNYNDNQQFCGGFQVGSDVIKKNTEYKFTFFFSFFFFSCKNGIFSRKIIDICNIFCSKHYCNIFCSKHKGVWTLDEAVSLTSNNNLCFGIFIQT